MLECPKGKIARWASLLAEYDMTIYHKRGTELINVDFLSRFLDNEPEPFLTDRMTYFTAARPIPSLSNIIATQQNHPIPSSRGFATKGNVIYYHGFKWIPPSLRTDVIAAYHSIAPFHHPGVKKTKKMLMRSFNWPNLHQDGVDYLTSCLYCQRARSGETRLQGLFRSHPIPTAFDTVYMDFWQCHYNSEDFTVLTLIDQCTKWAECYEKQINSSRHFCLTPLLDLSVRSTTNSGLRSRSFLHCLASHQIISSSRHDPSEVY